MSRARNNPVNSGDDLDYDPDPEPDYDPNPVFDWLSIFINILVVYLHVKIACSFV